jgi:hypothetical protein
MGAADARAEMGSERFGELMDQVDVAESARDGFEFWLCRACAAAGCMSALEMGVW